MNKKKYISKHSRESDVKFVFTDRDIEILKAINRYRYLRTNQITRLVFLENKTHQSTRRRLKYLYHNKFLDRVVPFIQAGESSGETAYFLDKEGAELLEDYEEEVKYYPKANQAKHRFLRHALDLSEFRVNLEIALKDHPIVSLARFTADFEIKSYTQNLIGNHIFKLYNEVTHPFNKKRYVVYPDARIILKGKGEYEKHQKLYYLEVDRGTESLQRIKDKVIGYNIYRKLNFFKKDGKFDKFLLLIQTNSEKRAKNIRNELTDLEGSDLTWVTSVNKVNEKSIISEPIWEDYQLQKKSILKTGD